MVMVRDRDEEVVQYIEHNLSEPLDVDILCKIACMSRSKFLTISSHL